MVDSRTNPMDVNQVGDDTVDAEICGDQVPLKMDEGGTPPPPGSLDVLDPDAAPAEDNRSDPGLTPGSRDPDAANSVENDGWANSQSGDTPYDAPGTMGSEGE